MNRQARELLKLALEFATQEEADKYKQEHEVQTGTEIKVKPKLHLKNPQPKQKEEEDIWGGRDWETSSQVKES